MGEGLTRIAKAIVVRGGKASIAARDGGTESAPMLRQPACR
jgi:hypothetical protein